MSENTINVFKQYKAPFPVGSDIPIAFNGNNINTQIKIGFTIDEKDYMRTSNPQQNKAFSFILDGEEIQMGRTFIYEPGDKLSSGSTIRFTTSPPPSFTIDVLQIRTQL